MALVALVLMAAKGHVAVLMVKLVMHRGSVRVQRGSAYLPAILPANQRLVPEWHATRWTIVRSSVQVAVPDRALEGSVKLPLQ